MDQKTIGDNAVLCCILPNKLYKVISESIKKYDEVLLFGPTNAKVELSNILENDLSFSKINIEIRHADKMTENQEHAFVRDYFSN